MKTPERHVERVQKVLYLLKAGAVVKPVKYSFISYIIVYIGHVVHPTQSDLTSHTTDATRGRRPPTSITKQ